MQKKPLLQTDWPNSWLGKISPHVRPVSKEDAFLVRSHASFGKCPAHFSSPLRIIYDHEVILYRNCACSLEFEDEKFICKPDTFIIIPPGKWHSEICLKSRGGYRYWCHFDWQPQSPRVDSPVMTLALNRPRYEQCHSAPDFVPPEIRHGAIPNPTRAYELAKKLRELTSTGLPHGMLLAGAVLHELLIELLDVSPEKTEPIQKNDRTLPIAGRIRHALDRVSSKPYKTSRMSEILSDFNYSYEHLCRIFKKAYGVSPLQYIHAQQMNRAKALLKNSELQVAEICYSIGMNSPAYFTKTFRSLIGKTPSDYRRGLRE